MFENSKLTRRRVLQVGTIASLLAPMPVAADQGPVIVFGASRNTGLEVSKILSARGDGVVAFVRETSDRSGLTPLRVTFAVGDALDPPSIAAAFAQTKPRAVICTIAGSGDNRRADFEGVRNIVDATKAAGIERFLLITVTGAGDSLEAAPERVRKSLARVIELKTQAEDYLMDSGLAYTIIRPGGLSSEPASGGGKLYADHTKMGRISRADLGRLIIEALDDPATIGKVYHAVDEIFPSEIP